MPSSSVALFALSTLPRRSDANVVFAARTRRGGTKGGGTTTSTARGGRRRRHGSRVQARKGLLAERFGEDETDNKVGEDDEDHDERECSCGSGETYEACCKRLHEGGIARDSSPESIVRARFTSYKENAPSFIVKSTHEESPDFAKRDAKDMAKAKAMLESDAKATAKKIRFLSLKIINKSNVDENESGEAFVSYECAFDAGEKRVKKSRAKAKTLAERARYRRDKEGKWKYVEALQLNDNVLSADGFDDGGHNRGKSSFRNGNLGKIF